MRCMVTGGAGYIGSHCCARLLRDGHEVVVLDNLFRGHAEAIDRLRAHAGGGITLVRAGLNDAETVRKVIAEQGTETVFHFGALAYVGESVEDPLGYYRANVAGMGTLLEACAASDTVTRFVFSSSCATYGDPPEGQIPVTESCPQHPTSPYGRTKLVGEWMLRDFIEQRARAGRPFAAAALRYFNVAGCDRAGLLGEDHTPETHLIPVAIQAAMGKRDGLSIFGTDYPTPDGTCVRDYVHVEDLVDAHVRALGAIDPDAHTFAAYNVGIGHGYSVREVIESVKRVSGVDFPVREAPRRAGDAVALYNDPTKIRGELGWTPEVTDLDAMVASAWDWFRAHPDGYAG